MADALVYRLALDALNPEHAHYAGPNGSRVTIDRAAFDGQEKPRQVFVLVTEDMRAVRERFLVDSPTNLDHEHVYRCQDCGEIGRAPGDNDGPT